MKYRLLSDSAMSASQAFGITFRVDDKTIRAYKGFGIDLAGSDFQLPVPSVFLVDTDGKIRFRYYDANYRERIDPEDLLTAAREAAG